MKTHHAHAEWKGDLKKGVGTLDVGSGTFEGRYDFGSRFGEGEATTPEELLGAAHAGCYSMALSKLLSEEGHEPRSVDTRAKVNLSAPGKGSPTIESIDLVTKADVPGVEPKVFSELAEKARTGCIISQVAKGTEIRLDASLTS